MAQSALKLGLLAYILIALNACQWSNQNRPNVLVIAIEGLDFESMSCLPDLLESYPGFAEICRDSVRFTHAYTPSVLSQAALASILTGRYPFEHGVRHNGAQFLSEELESVAETAGRSKFRTSFFSGGAPILRKSGFAQGFEVFDDNISLNLNRYYRPAAEVFATFLKWQEGETDGANFFSFIYLNDLLYYIIPTRNELGVERSLTRESQVRAIDLALQSLVRRMKQRKIWDNTHVVVTGLNGEPSRSRRKELPATNLYGENTQVALMIKPARKARDEGAGWSIDANVSLVDLGVTLFALAGENDFAASPSEIESVSLTGSLERPKVSWEKDRAIISESGWARWRDIGGIRYSARRENWFYLFGPPDYYFNTLIDRSEVSPMRLPNGPQAGDAKLIKQELGKVDDEAWVDLADQLIGKLRLGQKWAESETLTREDELALRGLAKESPWDHEILAWLWRALEKREDWSGLANLASNGLEPVWLGALARVTKSPVVTTPKRYDPCSGILQNKIDQAEIGKCKYQLIRSFGFWVASMGTPEESRATNRFIREYYYGLMDSYILRLNYLNGTIFDSKMRADLEVELMDLVLRLPEYRKYRTIVSRSVERLSASTLNQEQEFY